jgi:hypothetical protein
LDARAALSPGGISDCAQGATQIQTTRKDRKWTFNAGLAKTRYSCSGWSRQHPDAGLAGCSVPLLASVIAVAAIFISGFEESASADASLIRTTAIAAVAVINLNGA